MAKSRRTLKICCIVTAILVIILIVTTIILYYTLFKPKQPKITTQSVTLESFVANVFDVTDVNVTLGITVMINNPNYGGFKYRNTTSYVSYHEDVVAEASIMADSIPARGRHDVSTMVLVVGKRLVTNQNFSTEFKTRVLNFTSITIVEGKAIVLKWFKKKARVHGFCHISINFDVKNSTSECKSKVKF